MLAAGLSASTIADWVRAGHLHPLHRGVYAVGHPNVSREGRYMAAVLAGGEGAVLSHTPSARVLGLDRTRGVGTIHLTLPRDNKRSPKGLIVHRPRLLERQDITHRSNIPTTTATRTLFDQSALLSPAQLRTQFDQAVYLELIDRPRLSELLKETSGRRGLGHLRALLGEQPIPLSRTRSHLERIILRLCRDHGLPLPAVNVPVLDYEVDFCWPQAQFIVEADGGQHKGPQRDRDNERDITLARAGKLVRRYGPEPLKDERAVAREILEILTVRLPSAPSAGP